ncbi:MAG: carbonic anhydrase family protein [Crocinitomicaceae bacterium]
MRTQTKETQKNLTPQDAHRILVEGNKRFVENKQLERDLQSQVIATSAGQFPFAVILSCIDSRVPAELVFDQGIGDVFSVRVAGNVINEDILGSMEFGCKVAGSKIVVVMGHTKCGAVGGACGHVEMGNLTTLLDKIQPAVKKVNPNNKDLNADEMDKVAEENVRVAIADLKKKSPILKEMDENGEIEIVGAMYSVESGKVEFL